MKSMTAVRRRRYVRRWFAIGLQTRCIGGAMKALTWCGHGATALTLALRIALQSRQTTVSGRAPKKLR